MSAYFDLELRKLRLLASVLIGLFLASLPVVVAGFTDKSRTSADVLNAALLFWSLIGLPVSAMLLAAVGGLGLRTEPAASAEEAFPISPTRRAGASLAAVSVWVGAFGVLFLAVAFTFSPAWNTLLRHGLTDALYPNGWDSPPFAADLAMTLPFVVLYLAATAFLFSFVTAQGVLGALLGLVLAATTGVLLALGWSLHEEYAVIPFRGAATASVVFCLAGTLWALRELAPWAVRRQRRGLARWALVAAALVVGVATAAQGFRAAFAKTLRLPCALWSPGSSGPRVPGVLVADRTGRVALVTPEGVESEVWPGREPYRAERLFGFGMWPHLPDMSWDKDGTLWLVTNEYTYPSEGREGVNVAEIWHGSPPESMRKVATLKTDHISLITVGESLFLQQHVIDSDTHSFRVSPLPDAHGKIVWKDLSSRQFFKLTEGDIESAAYVRFARGEGWVLARRDPFGKKLPRVPLGGVTKELLALPGADGSLPEFVRDDGGTLWFVVSRLWLVAVKDGKVLTKIALPESADPKERPDWRPLKEGLVFNDNRTVHLVRWDGSRRVLYE